MQMQYRFAVNYRHSVQIDICMTKRWTQYNVHSVTYRSIELGEPDPELIKLTIYTAYTTLVLREAEKTVFF